MSSRMNKFGIGGDYHNKNYLWATTNINKIFLTSNLRLLSFYYDIIF